MKYKEGLAGLRDTWKQAQGEDKHEHRGENKRSGLRVRDGGKDKTQDAVEAVVQVEC